MDARYFTTPIGATLGVALSRALIDKKDRTLFNQAVGGLGGAGAGYVGGGYLNEALQSKDPKDIYGRLKQEYISRGSEYRDDAPMSDKERELLAAIAPKDMWKFPTNVAEKDVALYEGIAQDHLENFRDKLRSGWAQQQGWGDASKFYAERGNQAASRIADRFNPMNRLLRVIPGIKTLRGGE